MAKKKIESIYIDEKFCKGCDICIELCPKDVFTVSPKINSRGYYVPLTTYLETCNVCKICELVCPEMAIILHEKVDG